MSATESNTTWIFGCSSPLGNALTSDLLLQSTVLCFGRRPPDSSAEFQELDFSRTDMVDKVLCQTYAERPPVGIVFCQRYRPPDDLSEIEATQNGLAVELSPVLTVANLMQASSNPSPLRSIVLLSSVVATESHLDVPIYYQLLKSATLTACKVLASRFAHRAIRVNCILLGEFLKSPRHFYPEYKLQQFSELEKLTLDRRICSLKDIVKAVKFLLSDDAAFITGQELTLDGGLSLHGAESLLRRFAGRYEVD